TFPGEGSEYITSWTTTDGNGNEVTQSGLVTANDSTTSTLSTYAPVEDESTWTSVAAEATTSDD
ncbi:hypothetical protein G210_5074, partial [Candida maltosa Xu316]